MKARILTYCLAFAMIFGVQVTNAQNKGELKGDNRNAEQAYADLLQSEESVKAEIESINSMLPTLSAAKAKKATKRLLELDSMNESIQRRKSYYPQAIVNKSEQRVDESARNEVKRIIEEKVRARGGSLDDEDEMSNSENNDSEPYWTVVISISSSPDKNKYKAYGDVDVDVMGDKYIFFVGNYSSKSAAEARCKQIVKQGKFRDAFVVKRGE